MIEAVGARSGENGKEQWGEIDGAVPERIGTDRIVPARLVGMGSSGGEDRWVGVWRVPVWLVRKVMEWRGLFRLGSLS